MTLAEIVAMWRLQHPQCKHWSNTEVIDAMLRVLSKTRRDRVKRKAKP